MPITVQELVKSRRMNLQKVERAYVIRGAPDEANALGALLSDPAVPGDIDTVWIRVNAECYVEETDADDIYVGHAFWYLPTGSYQPVGSFSISFDIAGQTVHKTHSRETVFKKAAAGKTLRDFNQAVNVVGDGADMQINGYDIQVPAMTFTLDYSVDPGEVNDAYIGVLHSLVGTVNEAPFKGFDAGELLFTRVSGQRKDRDAWNLSFGFAASRNISNYKVGSITGIPVGGWEYVWAYYQCDKTGAVPSLTPLAVYVERVYDTGNYNTLGLP